MVSGAGEHSNLSTVSENDRDWKDHRIDNGERYNHRSNRNGVRGRGGRARGTRRPAFNRPANRMPSDPEYPDYPTDFSQVRHFFNILLIIF